MTKPVAEFKDEADLSATFCSLLVSEGTPWEIVKYNKEFEYLRGRTDIVASDKNGLLIAFELKLLKWKTALQQAYRNTCFAHYSYVVLPSSVAYKAEKYIYEFKRRSVGLCYVLDGKIIETIPARYQQPIQPWLSQRAIDETIFNACY